jgi:hypothetical protein
LRPNVKFLVIHPAYRDWTLGLIYFSSAALGILHWEFIDTSHIKTHASSKPMPQGGEPAIA